VCTSVIENKHRCWEHIAINLFRFEFRYHAPLHASSLKWYVMWLRCWSNAGVDSCFRFISLCVILYVMFFWSPSDNFGTHFLCQVYAGECGCFAVHFVREGTRSRANISVFLSFVRALNPTGLVALRTRAMNRSMWRSNYKEHLGSKQLVDSKFECKKCEGPKVLWPF